MPVVFGKGKQQRIRRTNRCMKTHRRLWDTRRGFTINAVDRHFKIVQIQKADFGAGQNIGRQQISRMAQQTRIDRLAAGRG